MKQTLVVSAFPGTGKSWFAKATNLYVADSDSSKFDKSGFPHNYVRHIADGIGIYDIIFVSSHAEVRSALSELGVAYTLVYPRKECKDEYIARYVDRGSPEQFVDLLRDKFEEWIDSCSSDTYPTHYELAPGGTITTEAINIIRCSMPTYDASIEELLYAMRVCPSKVADKSNKEHLVLILAELARVGNRHAECSTDPKLSPRQRAFSRDKQQNVKGIIAGINYAITMVFNEDNPHG